MAIITFINNIEEETGKTMSLVAIATNMAVDYNNKILVISTTNRDDKIENCFFENTQVKKIRRGIFGVKPSILDNESGMEGIAKMIRSGKLTPQMITNYTKVVFKDRLEVILGTKEIEENEEDTGKIIKIENEYMELIRLANQYYDRVLIDLDNNISPEIRQQILDYSDLVIVNTSQNFDSLKQLKERKTQDELLKSPRALLLMGRYDKYSKYNVKNVTRFLEEKNQILTIPYNTLFFEATNESDVANLFLKFKKMSDPDDRNAIFIKEVRRATENIIYRLQELQARG